MILDTNAISDLFVGNTKIRKKLETAPKHHIPVIVLGEYRFGLISSQRKALLEKLLSSLERESYILFLDKTTTFHYAEIRQQLKISGTPIPENNIWIAALARQYQLDILSHDRHYDLIEDIRRIGWK